MNLLLRNLLIIAFIIIIGIIIAFKLLNLYTLKDEHVIVPNLIGKSIDEIPNSENLDFRISDSVYNKNLQRGIIVSQFPEPHSEVKLNRTILLTYNRKVPQLIIVPDVIDQTEVIGMQNIKMAGFVIGRIDTVYNSIPVIISMSWNKLPINGGELLEEGSVIDIKIGKEE